MDASSITTHKTKHLLSHVLVAAGARRWPEVALGESGETATGFYADFGLDRLPSDEELAELRGAMVRILTTFRSFRDVRLSPAEALRRFAGQPWRRVQVAALAETDEAIGAYELDGFVDLCTCVLKTPDEMRSIPPEGFLITGARTVTWQHRGASRRFVRVEGELFPPPRPCRCCPP